MQNLFGTTWLYETKCMGRSISQAFKRVGWLLGKGTRLLLKETKEKLAFFFLLVTWKKRRCKKSPAESGIALIDRGPTHEWKHLKAIELRVSQVQQLAKHGTHEVGDRQSTHAHATRQFKLSLLVLSYLGLPIKIYWWLRAFSYVEMVKSNRNGTAVITPDSKVCLRLILCNL